MDTLADFLKTVTDFRIRYGQPPPQPLHISSGLSEEIEFLCLKSTGDMTVDFQRVAPMRVYGFDCVVDERLPRDEMRLFYRDYDGNLQLVCLKLPDEVEP